LGIRLIEGDNQGNLWLVTQVGLFKYNPVTDELVEFDEHDGLSGARYFVNMATQSNNGTIFVSSRNGIHYFDPTLIAEHPLNSKTVLTGFEVLGKPVDNLTGANRQQTYSLAPDENYIRFDFSTLDMLNARQIQYRYKLEGLDEQWLENGTSNTVLYSNLSGGNYKFRVQPSVRNDLVYQDELTVDINIAIPLWQNPWMQFIYACLVFMVVGYYVRRRQTRHLNEISQQKQFVSQLELKVAEKTREIQLESDKLVEANKVKNQFLANMSHEIRTPLTAIIGLSESIIQGDVETNKVNGEVGRIHNQSHHLLTLLNDILDVTKIEENKLELQPYNLEVRSLLAEINDLFVSQAEAKLLQFSIISQLPPHLIAKVDGLRLKQVLINLISNALKFTETGQVSVIASQQESHLFFNVVDTGIGMSEEQLGKVFEFFTQADSSINRRFGGSGLGLALSQELVSMMGGELNAKSELGKGSIFSFNIPVTIVDEAVDPHSEAESSEKVPTLSGDILLAEDHPDNQRFISRLLERLGLNVRCASNGVEAVQLFNQSKPDLILLDIQMPLKDGIQTYRELRELGATQPIVAITANAMAHDVEMYKEIGFDDYLTKPIFRLHLIEILSRYMQSDMDVNQANDLLDGTEIDDLQQEFIKRIEEELVALEAAKGDTQRIYEIVHRFAGAAEVLGFKSLAKEAGKIERAARDGAPELPELLDNFVKSLQQF
jgi:signal transduction histidine kinase/CheY-like chemotaxis protein/HPt (histidine-containing phosphotransfer) domain-containing protein